MITSRCIVRTAICALGCILLLALAACGGSTSTLLPTSSNTRADAWPLHGWEDAVRSGSYAVVAVDTLEMQVVPLTEQLELSTTNDGSNELVAIKALGLGDEDHAYLHLKYDANKQHPVAWQVADERASDVVFLGIDHQPGVVVLGMQGIHGFPLSDGVLCEVSFANGAHMGKRSVSKVSDSVVNDLRFDNTNREELHWTYACAGDYNQDTLVAISDITTVGQNWKVQEGQAGWQVAQVADGDKDTLITIADVTQIAQNWNESLAFYLVQGGESEAGSFAGTDQVDASLETWIPDGGGFKEMKYTVTTPQEGAWYVVWAVDSQGSVATEHSNAAQYSSELQLKPPTGLIATHQGIDIVLQWNAPAGVIPDGYNAFVSDLPSMLGHIQMNSQFITGSQYTTPGMIDDETEHYFAVKAVYGGMESEYSNIYHYDPSTIGDAPQALTAVHEGDHIQLDWQEPASGAPDYYYAYISDNATMEDAIKVTGVQIAVTTVDVPAMFSPDSEHYFAVTATVDDTESDYSNIVHYTPAGDSDPPTWEGGGTGIEGTIPGDSQVTVSWYTATDDSPPVTYIVYYAVDGTFDWATASTVEVSEPATNTVVSELINDTTYEFGVRARDSQNNTDSNTITLQDTPYEDEVPVDSGVWQASEPVDDGGIVPTQQVGWLSDIEVHPTLGTIGIAHHNHSGQDLLYTEGTPGAWVTTIVSSSGDTGLWPDLEFHPTTGEPCIAYHYAGDANLEYAVRSDGDWTIETVDSGTDVGAFASLEFHPTSNQPCIAYFDAIGLDVRYAEYDGTTWDIKVAFNGAPGGMDISGAYCSLDFNPVSNEPGVAYMKTYDFSGLPQTACWITQRSGNSWTQELASLGPYNDIGLDTSGFANSLCYNNTGVPFIIHAELMGEVLITDKSGGTWVDTSVATTQIGGDHVYTDIEWHDSAFFWIVYKQSQGAEFGQNYGTEGLIDGSTNRGGAPSIDVSATDVVHASYLDVGLNQLRYAVRNGSGDWSSEVADAGVGGQGVVGERASMAYHPSGFYPMISYYDASNSALKYADRLSGTWRNETVANDRNDGSASQMGVASDGQAYIAYFTIGDSEAGLIAAKGEYHFWTFTEITMADFIDGGDVAGNYCSLGMNLPPTEVPGIAYYNATQRRMEFALGSPLDSYETTTVDEFNDPGRWSSVAFNPANKRPAIAYLVRDTQDLYFVERAGGGAWEPVAVDTTQDVGNRCSMCYSNLADPWISYYDNSNKSLRVSYVAQGDDWASDEWQYIDIPAPGGSTDYGNYSSIAWHPLHNRAAVAFYDNDAGKLWYVFIGDPAAPQAAVEVVGGAVDEGRFPALVFNNFTMQPSIAYHDVDNGDLRFVMRTAE